MADTKISALTAASAAAAANELAINDAGTSKKVTLTQIATYLQSIGMPVVVRLGADYTNSTTTGTEVTGLQFAGLVAGTYHVKWVLLVQAALTTTSPKFGVNYTGTVTQMSAHARFPSAGVTAATGQIEDVNNPTTGAIWAYSASTSKTTTAPDLGPWTGVVAANTNCQIHIEALLVVSDTGDLELWAGSEVATSVITVVTGSSGMLTRTA